MEVIARLPPELRCRANARRPLAALLLFLVVAATAGLVSVAPGTAHATPRAKAQQVRVTAGWEGKVRPGKLLPVRVALTGGAAASPNVAVRVQSGNGGTTVTNAVVTRRPDGSGRATVVVNAPRDLGTFDVVVSTRHGSSTDEGRATVNPITDEELVGVLPSLAGHAPPPATEPLSVPIGSARFTNVDLETLGVIGSLGPLGTLAMTGPELAALTVSQQSNVLSWLAAGGHLLVDAAAGPLAKLPGAWQPSANAGRSAAGLGEVRLTYGFLAAGQWAGAVEPTSTIGPSDPDVVSPAFAGGPVGQAIAQDSGLRIPSLAVILGFLLGYVFLAGPATFFVLHKLHRAELAWVIVPLLAVGFTVGGFVVGGKARENTRTAYSASVFETPGANLDLSFVGVLSRQGGNRSVQFPAGWWGGNVANELYGAPEANVTTTVQTDSTNAQVSLVGGEFAVLGGKGPSTPTSRLQVQAKAGTGGVSGTVRNTTTQPFRQVAVFVGGRSSLVGDLGAGQSRAFTVLEPSPQVTDPTGGPDVNLTGLYSSPENKVWPTVATQTVDKRKGPVDLALWGEATRSLGPDLRTPGSAVAVGWASGVDPSGHLGAGATGRTAVIARTAITAGPTLTGIEVRRELLRGPASTPISDSSGPTAGAVFRFVLPNGNPSTVPTLELSVPVTLSRVDVWDGQRWQTILGSDGNGSPNNPAVTASFAGPPKLVGLPAGSVIGGTVYVRIAVRVNGPSNSAAELFLRNR